MIELNTTDAIEAEERERESNRNAGNNITNLHTYTIIIVLG